MPAGAGDTTEDPRAHAVLTVAVGQYRTLTWRARTEHCPHAVAVVLPELKGLLKVPEPEVTVGGAVEDVIYVGWGI